MRKHVEKKRVIFSKNEVDRIIHTSNHTLRCEACRIVFRMPSFAVVIDTNANIIPSLMVFIDKFKKTTIINC